MSVAKRGKKGVFYMNFMVNGRRIYRSTGKFSKREALLVEAVEKQKILNEASLTPKEKGAQTLLQEAADQVYEAKWKHGKDSERSYRRACNLVKLAGNIRLGEISEEKVEEIVQKLDARKAAPGTINRYLAALKTILRYKKQDVDHIKLRKERKGRIRVISRKEEKSVVELLRKTTHAKRRHFFPDVADLVEVLVDTGMRLSEALNLRYEDVNFATNLISIWVNKGDRPRSIPMTKRVRNILETRNQKNQVKPFMLKPYQAENAWRWVRKEMGLQHDKEFVLHALRHTTASRLVNKNIDLYVIKEWLGHSSIQVTERYAHLAPSKLAHAASVLEN